MPKKKPKSNAIRSFLIDLLAVCRKHNMAIGGCGCCGSPFISQFSPDVVSVSGDELDRLSMEKEKSAYYASNEEARKGRIIIWKGNNQIPDISENELQAKVSALETQVRDYESTLNVIAQSPDAEAKAMADLATETLAEYM